MAGDLNKPGLTDTYVNWPTLLKNLFTDLLKMDGSTTNLPAGTIKSNPTNKRFEIWSGAAWGALFDRMAQDVTSVMGYAPATGAAANTIPVRDSNGKLPGDILGNAATASVALALNGFSLTVVAAGIATIDAFGQGDVALGNGGVHTIYLFSVFPVSGGTREVVQGPGGWEWATIVLGNGSGVMDKLRIRNPLSATSTYAYKVVKLG